MEIAIFVLIIVLAILTKLENTIDFKCGFVTSFLYSLLLCLYSFNLIENRSNIVDNNKNDLIITSIQTNNNKKISKYTCKFYKNGYKYSESTIRYRFYDEIGKFNIGDTLKIVKK